jgi:SH3-like domain-containing protein
MRRHAVSAGCALAVLVAANAFAQRAIEYRSVADGPAILYDAPSVRGRKLFVAPRGMPFEVVVSVEGWIKLRDRGGDMAWIERRQVAERRTVVSTAQAVVRERADDAAPVLLTVAGDVVLELLEPVAAGGWARVRHRDGVSGYVRATQVWGL